MTQPPRVPLPVPTPDSTVQNDRLVASYHAAQDALAHDSATPSAAVHANVMAYAQQLAQARIADPLADSAPRVAAPQASANDSQWKIRALASVAIFGFCGMLFVQWDRASVEEKQVAFGTQRPESAAVTSDAAPAAAPAPTAPPGTPADTNNTMADAAMAPVATPSATAATTAPAGLAESKKQESPALAKSSANTSTARSEAKAKTDAEQDAAPARKDATQAARPAAVTTAPNMATPEAFPAGPSVATPPVAAAPAAAAPMPPATTAPAPLAAPAAAAKPAPHAAAPSAAVPSVMAESAGSAAGASDKSSPYAAAHAPAAAAPTAPPVAQNRAKSTAAGELSRAAAPAAPSAAPAAAPEKLRREITTSDAALKYDAALFTAIRNKDAAALQQALDNGADKNARRSGTAAIVMATQTGQIELVRLLIAAGADVNVSDPQGLSALEHARNRGFTDIAALLMRSGAK